MHKDMPGPAHPNWVPVLDPPVNIPKTTADHIAEVCEELAIFLCQKNQAYGDSAVDPVRIFSKADPIEQIKVRLDDKLSRLMRGNDYPGDDDRKDILGYLILWEVAERVAKQRVV